jgi:hypothetical protein
MQDVFAFNRNPSAQTAHKALCSLGISRALENKLPVTPFTMQRILEFAQESTLGKTWIYMDAPETEEELEEQQMELWRELMGVLLALDKTSPRHIQGFLERRRSLAEGTADLIVSRYE